MPYHSADDIKGIGVAGVRGAPGGLAGTGFGGVGGRSSGDGLSLDLQFATDKSLTARKGPTPTFTRGSGATLVNSAGLIEYAPENLILQSEDFSTTWTTNQLNTTGTPPYINVETAPSGQATADKIIANSASSTHQFRQSVTLVGGNAYTLSVYFKAAEQNFATFQVFGTANGSATWVAFYRVAASSPSVGTFTGFSSISIEDAGNGWRRCIANFTATASGTLSVRIGSATGTSLGNDTFVGDNSGGIFVWGAQLEVGPVKSYNPTTSAAFYGPRFDHDPVTLASKGLLIEESRTNLILQSESFSTTWLPQSASISNNVAVAPDGLTSADRLNEDTTNANHQVIQQVGSLTAGQPYTISVFAKAATHTTFQLTTSTAAFGSGLFANFILTGSGSIGASSGVTTRIESYPNGWYRCSIAISAVTGGTGGFVQIASNNNNSSSPRLTPYIGTNAQVVNLWGAQLEAGSFATSYIPTTTASVVRSADVCSISGAGFTGMWNALEGSLLTSAIFNAPVAYGTSQATVDINDNTTANRLRFFRGSASGFGSFANTSNSTQNVSIVATSASQPFTTQKYASGFKLDDYAFYINNSQIGTDNLGAMPISPTTFTIGDASAAFSPRLYLNGTISSIRYYRKRLSNTKLQAITV